MATDLARLVVRMTADNAQLHKKLDQSNRQLAKFAKNTKTTARASGVALGNLLADAAKQFAGFAQTTLNQADATSKLAQSIDVAVSDLSRLGFAAELNGSSVQGLNRALLDLSKRATETAAGTGEARAAFEALGVEVTDNEGNLKNVKDLLFDVADAFQASENGAAKAAVAEKIFGEAGRKLIPFLNQGREGLGELGAEADRLGVTLNDKTGPASEQFNDTLTRIEAVVRGKLTKVVEGLLPTLQSMADRFLDVGEKAGEASTAISVLTTTVKGLETVGTATSNLFDTVGTALGGLAAAVRARFQGDLVGAANIVKEVYGDIVNNTSDTITDISEIWEELPPVVDEAADEIGASTDKPKKKIIDFASATKEVAKSTTAVKDSITPLLQALEDEAATLGFTATQLALYNLEQEGATEAQLEQAAALRGTIDAYEANEVAAQAAADAAAKAAADQAAAFQAWEDQLFNIAEFGEGAAKELQGSFADFLFNPWEEGVAGMAKSFGVALQRMIADAVAADLFARISGPPGASGGGGIGGLLGGLGSLFSGFFANGGTIPAGSFGIAGDARGGPELVAGPAHVYNPQQTRDMMGGGANITVNIAPQNNTQDMRRAAGQGARQALAAMQEARRYG